MPFLRYQCPCDGVRRTCHIAVPVSLGILFVDRYDCPFGAKPEAEVRRAGWSLCAAVASDVRCGRL